ncbi:hypothetical protein KCU62_g9956, partial [Aureobasidium sp. EXF-3399]
MNAISSLDAAFAMLQELCRLLGINQAMSTAWHPQTNGQDENTNQQMEQYLRAFVNFTQSDWVNWLPLAEFALNNRDSESTGMSPFFADCGRNMRTAISTAPAPEAGNVPAPARVARAEADQFAEDMRRLHSQLNDELTLIQAQRAERDKT